MLHTTLSPMESESEFFKSLFKNISPEAKERASKMAEVTLIDAAQNSEDESEANEAMRLLREKFDPTYGWCEDCDGLVCKEKDCCMNKFINALKPLPPDIAKFMDDNFFDLLK